MANEIAKPTKEAETGKFPDLRLDPHLQNSRSPSNFLDRFATIDVTILYLVLALLSLIPLVWLTPPFQVPDEQQHFFRAYQLSEGHLRGVVQAGAAGAVLPSSLVELESHFLGSTVNTARRPVNPTPLRNTLDALKTPLDPGRREFVDFSGSAFYSPLPYLPQVVAIAAGRAAGFSPLGLLYAARLANGLVSVFLVALALSLLPIGRMALFVLGLLPMVLFEFASASPDATVIAMAFLFTAIAMRARFRGRWSSKEIWVACLAGAVFCSLKPVYVPLLALGLPAIFRPGAVRQTLAVHVALFGVVLGTMVLWLRYASSSLVLPRQGTSVSAQLTGILAHPGYFALAVGHTIWWNSIYYFHSTIGELGWLSIILPTLMYWIPVVAFLVCILLPSPSKELRIGAGEAAWLGGLLGASVLLIFTALYLIWTPVGNNMVDGVQGRYFLPLGGIVAVLFSAARPSLRFRKSSIVFIVFILVAVEVCLTSAIIVHDYKVL